MNKNEYVKNKIQEWHKIKYKKKKQEEREKENEMHVNIINKNYGHFIS